MDDIEECGAGGVGDFGGVFAGEAEADVVLGKKDVADAGEVFGFVVADPEELGEGEAGEDGVGGEADDVVAAEGGVDVINLDLGALVAPDEGGADDGVGFIEKGEAVHLAGEADARDLIARDAGLGEDAADGRLGGIPPVFGALFGPERAVHDDVFVGGGEAVGDLAFGVEEEGAGAAGADVDAEPEHKRRC